MTFSQEPVVAHKEYPDLVQDARRKAFVYAAFELIAEKGVEGLRIRDVAARVGANVATLYYYYPTKEGLIQGVVDYIVQHIVTVHAPAYISPLMTPREALLQHFADLQYQLSQTPEIFRVMGELLLRASRDATIYPILKKTDDDWQNYLIVLLETGVKQEVFRADLESRSAAQTIMAFFKGITMQLNRESGDLERAISHLEKWVLR